VARLEGPEKPAVAATLVVEATFAVAAKSVGRMFAVAMWQQLATKCPAWEKLAVARSRPRPETGIQERK